MKTRRWIAACLVGLFSFGCIKRVPVSDEAGEPISEREIAEQQTSNNFAFYTVAGGALSFGASFFAGTMVARALDKPQNSTELWATTGVGTLIGTVLFARYGKVRDRNNAIESVKDKRKQDATKRLTLEKAKQEQVEKSLQDLKEMRAQQEAEKAKLEEELKKKKGKNGKN